MKSTQKVKVLSIDDKVLQLTTEKHEIINCLLAEDETPVEVGQSYEFFIWTSHKGSLYASRRLPDFNIPSFQVLEVVGIHPKGVLLDWGRKPFLLYKTKEDEMDLHVDKDYVFYLQTDEDSGEIVPHLDFHKYFTPHVDQLSMNDEIDMIVLAETELGLKVIVNDVYEGLLYHDQIFGELYRGQKRKAYVKQVREDGKLDIILQLNKMKVRDENMQVVLDYLEENGGEMEFTDKSSPDDIYETFEMSKKAFKRALGNLFKDKHVTLEKDKTILN